MTVNIGIIGAGNISDTHARAARALPDTKISAVYGTNAQKVERLAQAHGAKPFPARILRSRCGYGCRGSAGRLASAEGAVRQLAEQLAGKVDP